MSQLPTDDDESRPFAGMTDEDVHAELLRCGIDDVMIEKADARVMKVLAEARVRAELDRIGALLGFGSDPPHSPSTGG
jgi:hypothetical protein